MVGNDPDRPKDAPALEPEESRQAEIGRDGHVRGPMRYVLIVSVSLAVAALVIAYFVTG